MRALPLALMTYLGIGVVLNALVSVSAVVLSSDDDWRYRSPRSWVGSPPTPRDVETLATRDEVVDSACAVEERTHIAWQVRAVAIDYSRNNILMRLAGFKQENVYGVTWPMVLRIRAGWPMSSFEGFCWFDTGMAQPRGPETSPLDAIIQVGPGGPLNWEGERWIPIAPLWLGLIVNSVVLGALAALAVLFTGVLIRRRRLRAQLCTRCKYPLHEVPSRICPECGTAVPTAGWVVSPWPRIDARKLSLVLLVVALALLILNLLRQYLFAP